MSEVKNRAERRVKGCTHKTMILCDGAVQSHQKQQYEPISQWQHLPFAIFAIFAIFDVKETTEITCDGFRPISNIPNISFPMGMFSHQN